MFLERGCWFCSEQAAKEEEEGFTEFLSIWLERITLRYAFLLFFYSFLGDFWGLLVSLFIYMFFIFCGSWWRSVWSLFHFPHWYICTHALILVECSFVFTHHHLGPLFQTWDVAWMSSFYPFPLCSVFRRFPLFLVPSQSASFSHQCLRKGSKVADEIFWGAVVHCEGNNTEVVLFRSSDTFIATFDSVDYFLQLQGSYRKLGQPTITGQPVVSEFEEPSAWEGPFLSCV